MARSSLRLLHIFIVLTILVSQLGLISIGVADASAAPAQDEIPTNPSFLGVSISNVKINGGSNTAFVSPGSTFSLSLDYSIVDPGCPGCIDQIQIGFSTDLPFDCAYNGIPGAVGTSGSATLNVTAPSAPGVYYLGFDRAQHFSCAQALASGWWNGPPDSSRYIAMISTALVVNSTADTNDGTCDETDCTLREAINAANADPDLDQIHFDIPGSGVQTIAPTSSLPTITEPLVIDGTTQPGASCAAWPPTLLIELDGSNAGATPYGLDFGFFSADGSTVRGLVINRFYIGINGAYTSNNTFECNFIGTNAQGTAAAGNTLAGIYFQQNSDNNVIGGPSDSQRNLISGNSTYQINFPNFSNTSTSPSNNVIQNNYIGTNAAGLAALGGGTFAIDLFGSDHNVIRDNLISGNAGYGISISGDGGRPSGNHIIQGNRIGMDATGTGPLGNGGSSYPTGVTIGPSQDDVVGGVGPGQANIIANSFGAGVSLLNTQNAVVRGNSIYNNGGLDLDLAGDGVTFNHAGSISGPNNFQNYPVLSLATTSAGSTRVVGTLESQAGQTYTIDVYANETCHPSFFGGGQTHLGSFQVTTNGSGVASFDETLSSGTVEPTGITTTATGSDGTSEFSYCRPVSTANLNWAQAQNVGQNSQTQQYITDRFQEKWFKFSVDPQAKVKVQLTGLPGSAVSLHRDPFPIYNGLILPQNAAVLGSEASNAAFLPSGSLPSGSLPSGSLPSGSLPSGSLPSGSLPTGYLPSGSLPSGSLPSGSLPSGSLPSGSLPSGSLPSGSLPSGSLPSGSLPSGSLPSGSLPSGSLPSGSLPSGSLPSGSLPSGSLDAYGSAARRSVLGISLDPYSTVQTIERNTYDLQEDLYVRVVGPYSINVPFSLQVTVQGGVCGSVQAVPDSMAVISGGPASGSYQTVILTDSSRLTGTAAEIANALAALGTLAARSDVQGVVIDLADSIYPRVQYANTQADQNLACASAKNAVAREIKKVVDAYRAANAGLQYIVLAGGADVIPFFQVQDVSGLANEREYVVPVAPSTASEAGLRTNLVQGQDGYGSTVDFNQAGHSLPLPDLAVGRLVDTAADITTVVNAYISTNGVVQPNSSLVTGYDFVGDAAVAIKAELDAGTNSTADTLIQAPGLPPTDPSAWTADELRTKLLSGNFDIAVLTGHFSAGNLLAADYATQLEAAEIAASSTDLNGVLVLTLGCHGGYSIPSSDLLDGVSPHPDWAKAFLRKGAAGYVAATGYAYGDTELTEYGERLFLLLTQRLRTGSGPISVGQALVLAKQQYLAETAQLTGIDHKTIVEMTLFGLPMMKVDMPGSRLSPPSQGSIVPTPSPVPGGPGANFGLSSSMVGLSPNSTTNTVQLENLSNGSPLTTTYLSGPNGVVANPFEPLLPKTIYNVSSNGRTLRGIAFRGGTYSDMNGIVPLTSSPTTETSTAHLSFNTDVFYPTQTWMANYIDAINGGRTSLILFPAQYRSSAPGAINGTLRKYNGLDLRFYYLPADWTNPGASATTKAAAVSAAPTILGASADVSGNQVTFRVNALADGSAGVQAVWVLYTGPVGSPYYGTWAPLDLVQSSVDPSLWEGTLTVQSGNVDDILFMVQAVGGAGLTTLASNLGAYYSVTPENATQLPPPAETTLTLQAPSSGTYLKQSSFSVQLESNGQPLANQLVSLDIGGQQALAVTNGSGQAAFDITLVVEPGGYTVQAGFRANAQYLASNDARSFTINKDSTSLSVTPSSATVGTDQPTPFVAVVKDSSQRALGGRSVFFVVHNGTDRFARSVIADYLGNARLGVVPLPPGTYTVDAYFNGTIPLGSGNNLTLSDDFYNSSQKLGGSLTIVGDTNPPTITAEAFLADSSPYTVGEWTNQTVTVQFTCNDADSGVATCAADQVFDADGEFTANGTVTDNAGNESSVSFGPIRIDKTAPTLAPVVTPNPVLLNEIATADAMATDSGSGVASQSCGVVSTNVVGAQTVPCTATDIAGNTATVDATYQVIFDFAGFFDPVKNPPVINQVISGRAIPLKFSLGGNQGLEVLAAGNPQSRAVQCDSLSPVDNVEGTLTAGSSSLSYDPATGIYTYVWKTNRAWANTCRQLTMQFIDGQTYTLNFRFVR